ncbi:DUF6660 family protein [Taibaiella koreensis]|uniref:DUF6660 family protein n=1 Tax=Taibaiella koreensis TaxID=1268548 RepID=UPI0013C31D9C|nr:DUF6660 family protein [Taibaiella koreensis]
MKLLCSILAILLLASGCIPCSDARRSSFPTSETTILTTVENTRPASREQGHEDMCAPFCQCSCCATACALPGLALPQMVTVTEIADRLFAPYLQQKPVGIALPIWQPPQLA